MTYTPLWPMARTELGPIPRLFAHALDVKEPSHLCPPRTPRRGFRSAVSTVRRWPFRSASPLSRFLAHLKVTLKMHRACRSLATLLFVAVCLACTSAAQAQVSFVKPTAPAASGVPTVIERSEARDRPSLGRSAHAVRRSAAKPSERCDRRAAIQLCSRPLRPGPSLQRCELRRVAQ